MKVSMLSVFGMVRDDIMMANVAAHFFSLKYKDHIFSDKKDNEK